MARALRVQFEGAVYHLVVRPVNRQPLFRDERDKKRYLELLARYRMQHGFKLYAFGLLSRHVDLLVETPRGNVSKVMQCLGTSYTAYFNRRYKRRGTLFDGRYRSHIVEWEDNLLEISRTIHRNHFRSVSSKGDKRSFPWSSYRIYLGKAESHLVDTKPVLNSFGQNPKEQRKKYQKFVEDGDSPARLLAGGLSLRKLSDSAAHGLFGSGIPGNRQDEASLKKAEEILRNVNLSLKAEEAEKPAGRRRGALARHVAMYLIRRRTSLPLRLIGQLLGVKAPAVAVAIGKVEGLLKQEAFHSKIKNLFESSFTERDPSYSSFD